MIVATSNGEFTEKLELNQRQGRERRVQCLRCVIDTRHKVLLSADVVGEPSDLQITWWNSYQIIQCMGCESISFLSWAANTEDAEWDPETNTETLNEKIELYPSRIPGMGGLHDMFGVPFQIRDVYDETRSALANNQPILAGVGVRTLLEAVCQHKGAGGSNLEAKIEDLVRLGVLTTDGSEILHSLRIIGNQSAHEIQPHSSETLRTALEIVENLIMNVYILPRRAKNLPSRKR